MRGVDHYICYAIDSSPIQPLPASDVSVVIVTIDLEQCSLGSISHVLPLFFCFCQHAMFTESKPTKIMDFRFYLTWCR